MQDSPSLAAPLPRTLIFPRSGLRAPWQGRNDSSVAIFVSHIMTIENIFVADMVNEVAQDPYRYSQNPLLR